MVIDVKDVTGEVMYPSEVELAREIGATRDVIPDLEALASDLEERGIYSIARVAVFEDDILPVERPDLAVQDSQTGAQWTNYQGQYWADAYDREVWEYNVAIAKEAAEAGFDEVQFDYVRFLRRADGEPRVRGRDLPDAGRCDRGLPQVREG